jgi:magnesium-transporting ATPase (P-type)
MPTALSVTMALGARLLAKKEAIVTRLSAIEELAGVDVLCSDKTGTRTQNKLTLGDPFTVDGVAPDKVILRSALASRAEDKAADCIPVLVADRACLPRGGQGHHRPRSDWRREGRQGTGELQSPSLYALRSGAQTHGSHGQRGSRQTILCGQGREDVQAVQDWEKANREIEEHETHK